AKGRIWFRAHAISQADALGTLFSGWLSLDQCRSQFIDESGWHVCFDEKPDDITSTAGGRRGRRLYGAPRYARYGAGDRQSELGTQGHGRAARIILEDRHR